MITRVRVEAEGRSPLEVEEQLTRAHEAIGQYYRHGSEAYVMLFGEEGEGQAEAQAGECVIERFARDCTIATGGLSVDYGPGHGAIFYKGRMTTHYARPSKSMKLDRRQDDGNPYHEG